MKKLMYVLSLFFVLACMSSCGEDEIVPVLDTLIEPTYAGGGGPHSPGPPPPTN